MTSSLFVAMPTKLLDVIRIAEVIRLLISALLLSVVEIIEKIVEDIAMETDLELWEDVALTAIETVPEPALEMHTITLVVVVLTASEIVWDNASEPLKTQRPMDAALNLSVIVSEFVLALPFATASTSAMEMLQIIPECVVTRPTSTVLENVTEMENQIRQILAVLQKIWIAWDTAWSMERKNTSKMSMEHVVHRSPWIATTLVLEHGKLIRMTPAANHPSIAKDIVVGLKLLMSLEFVVQELFSIVP